MTKIFLALMLTFTSLMVKAQTLKVTSVDSVDPSKYQEFAQAHLGKSLTLSFYDNALSIEEPDNPTLYLKKTGATTYRYVDDNRSETNTMTVEVHYTLNVVTSLTLTAYSHNKNGGYSNTVTAVAKRF
jgi:hypothetical protein